MAKKTKVTSIVKSSTPKKAASSRHDEATPTDPADMLRFVENLKRQWMSTIDALVDPLMIVDGDYQVLRANLAMARLSSRDVKDVVGRKCYEVFAGLKKPCSGCTMQQGAKSQTNSSYHLQNVRGDRFYEVTSQPLYDADGKPDGSVQVYRDRTEAQKMQNQLAQNDKLASIGLLAGGVAHEINNPLGGILIFSQMLLRELAKDSPHYPDVVEIEAATQRCKAIVEGLLDFARQNPISGSGHKAAKVVETDVVEAIRTAIRFAKVGIHRGGKIDIHVDLDEQVHVQKCDRNKIIQVFLNLIQNAVQAMPDGGSLVIRGYTRTDGDDITGVYEVEDTGVGIAPEHLNKIFDPFFTTKDPGEGTGLGLALCYGFVQDLAGSMDVQSTVNVGTCFTVELPLAAVRPKNENENQAS